MVKKPYSRSTITKSSLIVDTIKASIIGNPFISLIALQKIILEVFKFTVSKELIRCAIASIRYSKKNARFYGVPKNLNDKIKTFIDVRDNYIHKGFKFYSLDETSFGRHTNVVKGYSPIGKPLKIPKTTPRITTLSYLVLASNEGIEKSHKQTCSFNSSSFLEFLKSFDFPANSVVLLDNVSFHHSKVAKEYANEKGIHLLYTPPYSPWYNPIEGIFSIVKRSFYKDGNIEKAFHSVTSNHCKAFFQDSLSKKFEMI